MKWKGVFCKKKVENRGCFVKKVQNEGVLFCKKSESFVNAGCIMYIISIFYFTFYLSGGYAPNAPPAYGPADAQCCHRTNLYIYINLFFAEKR